MLQYVPLVVEVCTQVVEERGLANQGIYRVPGNSLAINNLVEDLNRVCNNVDPFIRLLMQAALVFIVYEKCE